MPTESRVPPSMRMRLLALSLLLAGWSGAAAAQSGQKPTHADPAIDPALMRAGFLSGHPDLRFRLLGLDEFKQGKMEDAFKFFQRAAYYADKPSQGMVAEMLWSGQGVAQDKALAYAWMDLAAERGYSTFLGLRERYWNALDEAERLLAVDEGQAIYSKYGDAAAKPRIATQLRRAKKQVTGSRTGSVGSLQIYVAGPGGFEQIDGSKFYEPKYWDPDKYQAWQDAIWMKPRIGRVSVGEVEAVGNGKAAGVPSRVPAGTPQTDSEEPQTPERSEQDLGSRPDNP